MTTLNQQLETIKSFNNTAITSVDFFSWGGTSIKFEATNFAFEGVKNALNIRIEKLGNNEFMFVSMLPNVA
tara:strand:+ start:172 stop:384 length:213 start_codon:yes stop_codon:yes gene_type:complete